MAKLKDMEVIAEKLGWQDMMSGLQILASGPLKEVIITGTEGLKTEEEFEARYPVFSPEKEEEINRKWQALNSPWPSKPIAAIKEIRQDNGIISLETRPAGFHQYIGTKSGQPRRLARSFDLDDEFILPVSFGAITVTKDGWIPVGLRSQKLAVGARKSDLIPSGSFDPVHEIVQTGSVGNKQTAPSLLTFIASELWEEMRVASFRSLTHLGLVQDCIESQQPQITVLLKLDLTAADLKKKLEQMLEEEGKEAEISRYDFVENDIEAVRRYPGIWTPHSASRFLLYFTIHEAG